MRTYELVLILPPEFSEEEQNKILEKVKQIVDAKGKVLEKISWGKKELAYPILKKTSCFYWFLNLELSPELATNLSRQLKLNEQVTRHLLIRKEENNSKEKATT